MRLAVFTSKYPARIATFFERDMRALVDAGIEIEVFSVYPKDPIAHRRELLGEDRLPADRLHHLTLGNGCRRGSRTVRHWPGRAIADAARILRSAAGYGIIPAAKTAYVIPKAWAAPSTAPTSVSAASAVSTVASSSTTTAPATVMVGISWSGCSALTSVNTSECVRSANTRPAT